MFMVFKMKVLVLYIVVIGRLLRLLRQHAAFILNTLKVGFKTLYFSVDKMQTKSFKTKPQN